MVLNYNVLINGIIIWVWFVLFGTRFLQSIKIIGGGGLNPSPPIVSATGTVFTSAIL
jgi:hypothetical protein